MSERTAEELAARFDKFSGPEWKEAAAMLRTQAQQLRDKDKRIAELEAWQAKDEALKTAMDQAADARDKRIAELEAKMKFIVCAFCGKETPRTGDVYFAMASHIAECEKHPMRAAVVRVQELEAIIAGASSSEPIEDRPFDLGEAGA